MEISATYRLDSYVLADYCMTNPWAAYTMHEFQKERQTVFHAMLLCLSLFSSKQCIIKKLLDSVFVICGIIKNEIP